MFDNDCCKEISAAYWAEEEEMKLGIHPSQVKERIVKELYELESLSMIAFLVYLIMKKINSSLLQKVDWKK